MVWLKRLGWLLLVVAMLAGGAIWLWWAATQKPEFYAVAELQIADPVERKQVAQEFVEQSQHFVDEIKTQPQWTQEFSDAQINSWLVEEFPGRFQKWVSDEISQPRVKIEQGGIRIGARVKQAGQWNGIVSVYATVRVLAPNELAIELQSVHAGLVPVPLKTVIEQISEQARANGIEIEWRRVGEREAAVVRMTDESPERAQLEKIEFRDGTIRVSGSSSPQSGALPIDPLRISLRPSEMRDADSPESQIQ